jgi:hypothetical protein
MTMWPTIVDPDLYSEIVDRVRNSAIQADHLFQTAILKRVEYRLEKKAFAYAAKRMIVPLCGTCNRGRGLNIERFDVLEGRFLRFLFQNNRVAMEASDAYRWFKEVYSICAEESTRMRRGTAG